MFNILIVEDEIKITQVIKAYLDKEGYHCIVANNGEQALEFFLKNSIDLIILDRMLPDISGEEICEKVRAISKVHIIMLTAKTEDSDKIDGFNIGCDDYVCKPFNVKELVLRVKAVFRKMDVENKDLFYKVFAYAMDAFGNEVSDMVIVRIDKRAPSTSLYLNNEQVLDKKIIKKLPEFEFLIDDNRANMRIEYYINGVLMDMDIEKVFNRMIKDDVLKVKTYTYAALSNFEIKEYEFMFSPDKKIEMVSKSEQILRSDEVATFERIWSVNEKNELVLEKNTKVLTSKSKPKIHYVRKKNKVQIFSKDQIESCFVNGKKIAIQKDVLGHDFVEISLKKSKTTIEVKAKNDSGVTTIKKSEIKKPILKKSFLQQLWIWIQRVFKL